MCVFVSSLCQNCLKICTLKQRNCYSCYRWSLEDALFLVLYFCIRKSCKMTKVLLLCLLEIYKYVGFFFKAWFLSEDCFRAQWMPVPFYPFPALCCSCSICLSLLMDQLFRKTCALLKWTRKEKESNGKKKNNTEPIACTIQSFCLRLVFVSWLVF